MSRTVTDNIGDIETICRTDPARVGDLVKLVFRSDDDADPPFNVRIKSPTGKVIVERVLRELPTGKPQSAPPIEFTASASGAYTVEVWQLYGKQRGKATVNVL
ncbi:hypothetical protein [Polyangium aurulentum]|uniref:hypothetical protein n=1 Tax=Polyangium aurulentum TaxID=2567896 RepID=UPI0010AE966D|nr:hypothetical protein [Polyangium aurulentum]UQA62582.1 hypothetical protein E8A73_019865 [Polyangium aurulentum]